MESFPDLEVACHVGILLNALISFSILLLKMSNQKRNLFGPLAGLVIAMLLVGSVFAPGCLASAASDNGKSGKNGNSQNTQGDDDKNNGKDNEKGEKDDKNTKCVLHRYDGKCDHKKPKIDITSPGNKDKVTGPSVTITGNAFDTDSGVKKVQMKIDGHGWILISSSNGDWSVTKTLGLGPHIIQVRAMDWAHNIAADHSTFKVVK